MKHTKESLERLRTVLDTPPPKALLERHKYGDFSYLPIDYMENMMDALFGGYRIVNVEVRIAVSEPYKKYDNKTKKETDQIDRFCAVSLDVVYFDPFLGKETFVSGAGSKIIGINQASETLAPLAKAEAFKNAVSSIAPILGKGLNRKIKAEAIKPLLERFKYYIETGGKK